MSKLTDNWIFRNLVWAIIVIVGLLIVVGVFLRIVTRHGQELSVPDFTGMTVTAASRTARLSDVRIDVVDSIYVKRMQRGTVVRQDPKPGASVKVGRRIQLTINAVTPRRVPMPNLVGYSLRSALSELSSRGFELGKLVYINDMATNNVLSQVYRGSEIAPGHMVDAESRIDLVLGLNPAESITVTPNLIGLKYRSAIDRIHENCLNVGRVVFDRGIRTFKDSINAVVYKQLPSENSGSTVMGRPVTVYLTLDSEKVPDAALAQ